VDGVYAVEYVPTKPGDVHVKLDAKLHDAVESEPIGDSPYNVPITPSPRVPSAAHTKSSGHGKAKTSTPSHFAIHPHNYLGEPITKVADHFDAFLEGPDGEKVPVTLVDDEETGGVRASYHPKKKGEHKLHAILKPEHRHHGDDVGSILESPFTIDVEPSFSHKHAAVKGLEEPVSDTAPAVLILEAKDENGDPILKGGEKVDFRVAGPSGDVPVEVLDKEDGTYELKYFPTEPGKHKVHVHVNDEPLAAEFEDVEVEEGASEEHSLAVHYSFTVRARTKKGTDKPRGGDKFEVKITGPNGLVDNVVTEDQHDGTYLVSYALENPGKYWVKVTLNGKDISGSPWKQVV